MIIEINGKVVKILVSTKRNRIPITNIRRKSFPVGDYQIIITDRGDNNPTLWIKSDKEYIQVSKARINGEIFSRNELCLTLGLDVV